jgi:N6-L-threonylcarbamoyladenine synthase
MMIVLGIETSCDDTSAAVIADGSLQSNIISTQLIHGKFGGVVPELASRSHIRMVVPVIREALSQAGLTQHDLQGIGVTYGPGLAGSLLVGLSVAKGMAIALKIPFIGINHLEGHIWSNHLSHPQQNPPFIILLASGGHTQLVFVKDWGNYQVLGRTRDDAAGEAFDKIGKLLQVGYPGGPFIEKLAHDGNLKYVRFPRAFLEPGSLDFSFSGLKTSVLNHVRSIGPEETQKHIPDIAACFQDAVFDVLIEKAVTSAKNMGVRSIGMAGGVAVNKTLQNRMSERAARENLSVFWPSPSLCTDNGGMIARAGCYYLEQGITSRLSLSPLPSLNF